MSIIDIFALFGIMIVLAAMPSSSVALVVARSATLGVPNGIAVTVGIVLGDLVFILLALMGLSFVAETMGRLFMIIKYLGAFYLLWLGLNLITSKSTTEFAVGKPNQKRNLLTGFLAGFVLTLGDIKAIIFYISLFPVFIDLSALNSSDVLTIILVMVLSVGGVKAAYAFSATKVASLARRYKFEKTVRKTAGALMVGAGSLLIVKA